MLYAEVVQISSEQLKQLIQSGVTVIDVRTPAEWKKTGIIEGSHPIMFFNEKRQPLTEQWMAQMSNIVKPEDELILICRSGNRSGLIANYLSKQHQFVRVYNVERGIKNWIAQGNQTVPIH
jgi:rhodanese-related sulfurtransferase